MKNKQIEKYGFVYIWRDRKRKMYYIGSHWGSEDDNYVCSSNIMKSAYKRRPNDFKRRIISRIYTNRKDLLIEEQKYISMIDPNKTYSKNKTNIERSTIVKYYNVSLVVKNHWHADENRVKEVGKKISESKKGGSLPCSPEKAKAISKAKLAKRPKIDKEKLIELFSQGKKITEVSEYFGTSNRHIREFIRDLGYNTVNELKPKRIIKDTMSREEQNELSSKNLKNRWSDPIWSEKQRKKLSEAAKNRPPRSEESKRKASISQLGIKKPRKINYK